jgi:hypothetical protein
MRFLLELNGIVPEQLPVLVGQLALVGEENGEALALPSRAAP